MTAAGGKKTAASLRKLLALAEHKDQLSALVDTLRAKGVTRLRVDDLELELAAEAPAGAGDEGQELPAFSIDGDKRPIYESDYDDPDAYPGGEVPRFDEAPRGAA